LGSFFFQKIEKLSVEFDVERLGFFSEPSGLPKDVEIAFGSFGGRQILEFSVFESFGYFEQLPASYHDLQKAEMGKINFFPIRQPLRQNFQESPYDGFSVFRTDTAHTS
jgi:hypothetical protein